ncbi:MAG: oxygenase MpaB family protein [Mycobacterium sp.]
MQTLPVSGAGGADYPRRFMAGESRNRKIGRPLQRSTGITEPDPHLLDRIGRALMKRDEPGAALVAAIRRGTSDPTRVTMRQFNTALESGVDAVPDCPDELRRFFDVLEDTPDWVDFELINAGARAYRSYGPNVRDVMADLSLIGGYRFGGPPDLLVKTGLLAGAGALRRMGETVHWSTAISENDGLRRYGEGFKLTVHVRLMHAVVNHNYEIDGRWDTDQWGLPINQADQGWTLGLFSSVLLRGLRRLGVRVTSAESRAVMHLWKYVGWLMGVGDDFLRDSESDQDRLQYHFLLSQGPLTSAGPHLANAIVDAERGLHFPSLPRLRRAYAHFRRLSMLRFFLGRESMRELELPPTPPVAAIPVIAANLFRYQILTRTTAGVGLVQRWGERSRSRVLDKQFGSSSRELAPLPASPQAS